MNNITETLFKLITEELKTTAEKDINLNKIRTLLQHSKQYIDLGMNNLAVEFTATQSYDNGKEHLNILVSAIVFNRIDVVKLLIQNGADVNISNRFCPLWYAAKQNFVDIGEYLISQGANIIFLPEKPSEELTYPLHVAVANGHLEFIRMLLLHGVDPKLLNKKNKMPIQIIINEAKNIDEIKSLLIAATHLNYASELYEKGDIFSASAQLFAAFNYNFSFIMDYLAKIINQINACELGIDFDKAFYRPKFFKIAFKLLKTLLKNTPELFNETHLKAFENLLLELNAYAANKEDDVNEKLFKTTEDKTKSLKYFERISVFTTAKANFKEGQAINEKSNNGNVENEASLQQQMEINNLN